MLNEANGCWCSTVGAIYRNLQENQPQQVSRGWWITQLGNPQNLPLLAQDPVEESLPCEEQPEHRERDQWGAVWPNEANKASIIIDDYYYLLQDRERLIIQIATTSTTTLGSSSTYVLLEVQQQ